MSLEINLEKCDKCGHKPQFGFFNMPDHQTRMKRLDYDKKACDESLGQLAAAINKALKEMEARAESTQSQTELKHFLAFHFDGFAKQLKGEGE